MSIKTKIFTAGILLFIIFIFLALLNLHTHRTIISTIHTRDMYNRQLAEIEDLTDWKNSFILMVTESTAAKQVYGSLDEIHEFAENNQNEKIHDLYEDGLKLLQLIDEEEQLNRSIENDFSALHAEVNRVYDELDKELSTVLARFQMKQIFGYDYTEENFLAPYILKNLNQLTLIALNSLISNEYSQEDKRIIQKNEQFISSQLPLLDLEQTLEPLFNDLFSNIGAIEAFISRSTEQKSELELKIKEATQLFNTAIMDNSGQNTLVEAREALSEANMLLEKASRQGLIIVLIFLIAGPALIIALGMFGLNTLIINPITSLQHSMSYIETGQYDATVSIQSEDEIGQLAQSFNVMAGVIKEKILESRKARSYITNIIDSMPSIIIGVDKAGVVTQWNEKAAQTWKIESEQALGKALDEIIPEFSEEMDKIRLAVKSRQIDRSVKQAKKKDQGFVYEDTTVYPLVANGEEGAVIRIDDVTEKVRIEEMMIQSEKMLSVGGLAAGMAHEINNPLAGILQTINVMENRLVSGYKIPASQEAAEKAGTSLENIEMFMKNRGILRMIATIRDSAQRVAEIVNNMLSFARKSGSKKSTYYLEELLDKTLTLASTDYDLKKKYDFRQIKIEKQYAKEKHPVPCESTKLQQVFLNIFRNGAQAMQNAGTKDPCFIIKTFYSAEEQTVIVEIIDNGPGMDETVRKRIFEPFYTTKEIDIGTGLGLSVSYFIVTENHNGTMSVESQPGSGAKFIISLPDGEQDE